MFKTTFAALLLTSLTACGPSSPGFCQSSAALTTDEHFLEIAKEAPAFGGLFLKEPHTSQVVAVWLTDLDQAAASEPAILDFLAVAEVGSVAIVYQQGAFTWPQLMEYRNAIGDAYAAVQGITSLDTDEKTNQVAVGVVDADKIDAMRTWANEHGIPQPALRINVVGRARAGTGNCN